jgi:hypothetical protein
MQFHASGRIKVKSVAHQTNKKKCLNQEKAEADDV